MANIKNSRVTHIQVLDALAECGNHRGRAAAKLGVTRRTVQYHVASMRKSPVTFPPAVEAAIEYFDGCPLGKGVMHGRVLVRWIKEQR